MIIATGRHHWKSIGEQLERYGLEYISVDKIVLLDNEKRINNICSALADTFSKNVFNKIISYRISGDELLDEEFISDNIYFDLGKFKGTFCEKETYIDAGAYVGDSLEKYISCHFDYFNKIYAFEPWKAQYNALRKRVRRLRSEWALGAKRIIPINAALSNRSGYVSILASDANSGKYIDNRIVSQKRNSNDIKVYALDEYLDEPIHFIKADVEGEELSLLKGASRLIKKYKPLLAISIYHRPQDLFEIPEYIKELVPEYKMSVRHYTATYLDTVLYCYL